MRTGTGNGTGMLALSFLIILFIVIMAVPAGAGIPMGSVTARDHAAAECGGSAGFKILFFNIHEKSAIRVEMGTGDNPEGWEVSADPESMVLPYTEPGEHDPEEGYEYLNMPGAGGIIKVKQVTINVDIPDPEKPGTYEITATARTASGEGSISMAQSRSFDFTVEVTCEPPETSDHGESRDISSGGNPVPTGNGNANKSAGDKIINGTGKTEGNAWEETEDKKTGGTENRSSGRTTGMIISQGSLAALLVWAAVIVIIIKIRRGK